MSPSMAAVINIVRILKSEKDQHLDSDFLLVLVLDMIVLSFCICTFNFFLKK